MKVISTFLSLLILYPLAVISTTIPHPTTPICDAPCIHRLLYKTAYSSAAMGADLVMEAYNYKPWCLSDNRKDWCPDMVNSTLTAIAGKAVTEGILVPWNGSEVGAVAGALSEAGRRAALAAMLWATRVGIGIARTGRVLPEGARIEGVREVEWMIQQLMKEGAPVVDSKVLQKAMDAQPNFGTLVKVVKQSYGHQEMPALATGLEVATALLGPFLGVGSCSDPILCTEAAVLYVSRMLTGLDATGVLPQRNWVKSLLRRAKGGPESLQMLDYVGQTALTASGGLDYDTAFEEVALTVTSEYSDTVTFWRSEKMDVDTGVLTQRILRYAPELAEWIPEDLKMQGYRPFRIIADGIDHPKIQSLSMQRPEDLHSLPTSSIESGEWRSVGDDGLNVLFQAGAPVLNSMGAPVVALPDTKQGLLSLAPVPVMYSTGHDGIITSMFATLDSQGEMRLARDGSLLVVVLLQSDGPPEVRISTHDQLVKSPLPDLPAHGGPRSVIQVTPDMPYVCTTEWSEREGRTNPPECSTCWAHQWEACYTSLKCYWDDQGEGIFCKLGAPNQPGAPFYGHRAIAPPLSHHVGLGTPYQCTDEYTAHTGKPNPVGCELCWSARKKECYKKFKCRWVKYSPKGDDSKFPLHNLVCLK